MRPQSALADLRTNCWLGLRCAARGGGIRRRLLVCLTLIAVAIALLPLVVANTPLRNVILSAAVPGDGLQVTVIQASLGWFSGLSVQGVELKDAAGKLLLSAESVRIDRSPIELLLNRHDLGTIEVVRPNFHVTVRPDGSNLEDAVESLLADLASSQPEDADTSGPSPEPLFAVRLVGGTIHLEDVAASRRWRAEGVELQYDAGPAGGIGSGTFAAKVAELGAGGDGAAATVPAGQIAISLKEVGAGRRELAWQINGLAFAPAEPWLRRLIVAGELSGNISGQGTATWTASASTFPGDLTTSGMLAIDRLDASAPALIGDRVRLARVELPWQVATQPAGLAIQDLQLRSEVGRVGVRGSLDMAALSRSTSLAAAVSNASAKHNLEMRGSLDLVQLAAMLPNLLRIRDDTTLTSGTLEIVGHCRPADNRQQIAASVRTTQLGATSAGRPLRWEKPVNADFQLTRQNAGFRLDAMNCYSEFLQVAANGTSQKFSASAEFDLNRLAEQLGQFVDLKQIELAGTGEASLDWNQTAEHGFTLRAEGALTQLRVALTGDIAWDEPEFEISLAAAGILQPVSRRPIGVESGQLQLSAQGDELDARLSSPVQLQDPAAVWPVSIAATGRIARWLTRARPWIATGVWQIDGQSELAANIRIARERIEVIDAKFTASDLHATSSTWNITEPRLELSGNGRWDMSTGEMAADAAQLVTSTVSLAAKNVDYHPPQASDAGKLAQLTGVAAIRADLARIAAWRAMPAHPPQHRPQGELTGNLRFAKQNGRIVGELTATGSNLSLLKASPGAPAAGNNSIWQEPRITLRALAAYEPTSDLLDVNQLDCQSTTLQLLASGRVENISAAANANVSGTLNYDLAQLTPLLEPYLGGGVQLVGRQQARFALAGQLTSAQDSMFRSVSLAPQSANHWSRRVRAQLELPWSGASLYGLPVGAGRIAATLGDGAVRIEPLSLAVGEGRLSATPSVRLDPQPAEFSLPAGPLLTNVRISPEVSEAMLKYVAPVLTGATQSEGLFSMQLDGARLPLGEMRRIDSAGKLTVHAVRVVPGPMARDWIAIAQQIEAIAKRRDATALTNKPQVTLLSIRDQQVNFRVVDGRVHHQNMEFQVGDVVMRSQGSVGLDETISLVLHIPIQDAWITSQPLLAGLKGQSLQVPISGTLTRPQMDQRAIASVSQQLLQSAAGQAIGGEVNKALDKLFKSR
jgi:translocation and assembly module TamB